jgi:hypothetical protein
MNLRIGILLLALICPLLAYAQPAEVALATLQRLVEAVRTGDAETVVNLTHAKVHEMAGGREKMLIILTETFQSAKNAGHKLDQVVIGQPSSFGRNGKQLFIFVPYIGRSRNNERSTTIEAFYLGISEDSGASWRFVDGSRMGQQNIKIFIPSYSGQPPLPSTKHTTERR